MRIQNREGGQEPDPHKLAKSKTRKTNSIPTKIYTNILLSLNPS